MINVKKDFKAKGNGSTDDSSAIRKAIGAANQAGGDTVFFPKGNYFLERPIALKSLQHIKLQGEEATILCKGSQNIEGVIGKGGGFAFSGSYITIEKLRFEGHMVSNYSTDYGFGRLLKLSGSHHSVNSCYFNGGNGGGIEILNGNNISITKNIFDTCNHHPPPPYTGDYGSIHLHGKCKSNTISENKIFGHLYSGISGYGTSKGNEFSELYIRNNYIKSNSANNNHSMGIYLLKGANQDIEITNNVIENADAECIIIFSHPSYPGKNYKIVNNVLYNGAYQGISLRSEGKGGTFTNINISNNFIANTENTNKYDHQIFLERVQASVIAHNTLKGAVATNGIGIFLYQNPTNNIVIHNVIENQQTGITFIGKESIFENNIIFNCKKGIRIAYCEGSKVANNIVNGCEQNVEYAIDKSQVQLDGNNF